MILRKKAIQFSLIFAAVFILFNYTIQAASIIFPQKALAEEIKVPETDYRRADVFVNLSVKDFSAMTGVKLNIIEKLFFKISQKQIRKDLKRNPDLLISEYYDPVKQKFTLDSIWFILGIMIGPLAILFSITSKRNKNSRKSAFLGFLLFVVWFSFFFII
jgi:hypothetical protein